MLMSASSEFVALCRSQVALLTQGMGAALSIVYLTEELVEGGTPQAGLIPVVAYPETAVEWEGTNMTLLREETDGYTQPLLHGSLAMERQSDGRINLLPSVSSIPRYLPTKGASSASTQSADVTSARTDEYQPHEKDHSLLPGTQIVLPLMYEDVVMGLLVTGRQDRAWNERELSEIERIAQTLAIARLLDQRREWFEQQLSQQQRLQAKQRDLLDNLLHQFRNPLTALRTFGKLLLKRLLPGDANQEVASNIIRESDRLTELLQQFDQVIDLTTDDIDPRKSLLQTPLFMKATVQPAIKLVPLLPDAIENTELCRVVDVLEPLLASARAIAIERNLNLHSEIPSNLPPVRANAKALREVLSNLLDNALKYTPDGGQIYIEAGRKQGNFQGIAISDTGFGIPPQDLGHIFERHYRGVQLNSGIAGTGLGLAIAKELIEQMQGQIEVFSPAQMPADLLVTTEAGTTFVVWLLLGV